MSNTDRIDRYKRLKDSFKPMFHISSVAEYIASDLNSDYFFTTTGNEVAELKKGGFSQSEEKNDGS
ncbi:hypothetical protein ACDT65_004488 [Salmonella enterica subsp. enterica]|nr:hypothetical protein [Salmonella enterica subsp. enterica]EIK6739665.1 hypothetical protein [Salmonella enterica subsp. enterica serovar Aqua]HCM8927843.1 hypothetical protein [Salmonella enterica subsp. enterica serovar Paratyphi B]